MDLARWLDGEMARWLFLATENTEYTERFFTKREKEIQLRTENGELRMKVDIE